MHETFGTDTKEDGSFPTEEIFSYYEKNRELPKTSGCTPGNFEKVFDVFSTNQIEARYLITPSMMERMLKLDSNFKKGITISFRNSTILVAIPDSKNRFEADVWSSLNDMSILKSDFAVLQSLLEIVDELNLNTRIWSKE